MHSIFGSVQWLFLVKSFLIFVINVFNDKCSLFSWHHNNHLCLKNNPKHGDSNLKMSEGTASPCDVVTPNHSVTVSKTHDNSLACPCGWTVHSDTVVRTNTSMVLKQMWYVSVILPQPFLVPIATCLLVMFGSRGKAVSWEEENI